MERRRYIPELFGVEGLHVKPGYLLVRSINGTDVTSKHFEFAEGLGLDEFVREKMADTWSGRWLESVQAVTLETGFIYVGPLSEMKRIAIPREKGKTVYIDGQVLTPEQIQGELLDTIARNLLAGNSANLARWMEMNKCNEIVRTRFWKFNPYFVGDSVVSSETPVTV